jgi:hypothetical protein
MVSDELGGRQLSEEEEEEIRKAYAKGMGYRALAKKYRKSFTQLSKIIKSQSSLSERVEKLEEDVRSLMDDETWKDGILATIMYREDFVPWCADCGKQMENTGEGYKCLDCGKEWP